MTALNITKIAATVTPGNGTPNTVAWRITRLNANITTVVNVDAGPNLDTIEPWTTVQLHGSTTPTGVWSQTFGPEVQLTTTGPDATYTAPAAIGTQTLQFTYTAAGRSDVVTHTVLPVTERFPRNGAWVPLQLKLIRN